VFLPCSALRLTRLPETQQEVVDAKIRGEHVVVRHGGIKNYAAINPPIGQMKNEDPMRSWKDDIEELDRKFRAHCRQTILENGIKQSVIGDAHGVNQSTVSRWYDLTGDLRYPACFTPALHAAKELHPLAKAIIAFQNHPFSTPTVGSINGDTQDEFLEAMQHLGKCVDHVQNNRLNLSLQDIDKLQGTLDRLREEIRLKGVQS